MNVGQVSHAQAHVPHPARTRGSDAATTGEKQPGVVRLLEAGHFDAVAELRLRTNHADRLEGVSLPPIAEVDHPGAGYQRALDAYRAASGVGIDAVEPAPVDAAPPVAVADDGVVDLIDELATEAADAPVVDSTGPGLDPTDPAVDPTEPEPTA